MEDGGGSDRLRESIRSSPLGIDLNEIPSAAESVDIVRTYQDVPDLPPEPPATPVLARGASACGVCGLPADESESVVVCDGCELGFHLACTGMCLAEDIDAAAEWVCQRCRERGVKGRGWPLGFKSKRKPVLDMNSSPPSDRDGEEEPGNASIASRKHTLGSVSFGNNPFDSLVRYPNLYHSGSGFGSENASGILSRCSEAGFQDIEHTLMRCRGVDVVFGSSLRYTKSDDISVSGFLHHNPSEIFLLALREYISQRNGVLEEGWHVELKQSNSGICATYCAPNGMEFDSMSGVASHLGLALDLKMNEQKAGRRGSSSHENFQLPKKRKAARLSAANGFTDGKEFLLHAYYKEFLSNTGRVDAVGANNGNVVKASEFGNEDDTRFSSYQSSDGLPVQFEDFFLLSLGTIDPRPSYHVSDQIWPVGYRSCWHDKITRSLFFCDVSNGGESGPVFKIRRCSCSSEPLPNGSIILIQKNMQHFTFQEGEESLPLDSNMELYDDDFNIRSILHDPLPPTGNEIPTFVDGNLSNACNIPVGVVQMEASPNLVRSGNCVNKLEFKDEIGEIVVEGSTPLLAWKKMSQKLVDAFFHRESQCITQFCKHVGDGIFWPYRDMMNDECWAFGTLEKFQSLLISQLIENGHNSYSQVMANWWSQDRFGLDLDLVQEMIEQLPDIEVCTQYEPLNKRSNYLKLVTLKNGCLFLRRDDGVEIKEEEALDSLCRTKRARNLNWQRSPPSGTSLCPSLLPELVGDCYQIWEVLWRFHEIMGLKETFSLGELEKELVGSGLDAANLKQNTEGFASSNLSQVDKSGAQTSISTCASITTHGEDLQAPAPTEIATQGSNKDKDSCVKRGACCSFALTKVHSILLNLLIGELQSKVAGLVDPSLDGSDLKPKRGKRRDIDCSVLAKRCKLNMLPINEMTWPELARRYTLAILSLDGNSDSAEVITRESSKVFRCLQGDGGLLCGSLAGIAGMEADALLLAEASKQIFGNLSRGNDVLTIEVEESAESDSSGTSDASEPHIPDWAKALEPVRKLPTNVGTRIRKCVYEALEKHPPEWARKILEHSISKEVYKGNASGPTKKAVLSVLSDASSQRTPQKPVNEKKANSVLTISDILMKQCRVVLRQAAAADDSKVFCNLLGRKLVKCNDNDDEGLLGSPAMVSRPLDFRTIDIRLAVGAYGGSYESFLEDVHELWDNLRSAFVDQPDMVELANKLSENFQTLCAEKVDPLVHQLGEYRCLASLNAEKKKLLSDIVSSISLLPKAPWDEGICKVCGVDKDDDSVLLCDKCDSEYHTYCLNPPLSRIPDGNWYCPSCAVGRRIVLDGSEQSLLISRCQGRKQGEVTHDYLGALSHLAYVMEEKEYWEYSVEERIFLLKFLCDELLNSGLIRQHLEQCADTSLELQQKLRSLSAECKVLKLKEEFLVRAIKADAVIVDRVAEALKEGLAPAHAISGFSNLETLKGRCNHLNTLSESQTYVGLGREISSARKKENCIIDRQNSHLFETEGEPGETERVQGDTKQQETLSSSLTSVNNAKSSHQHEHPASDPEPGDFKDLEKETLLEGRNIALTRHPDMNDTQSWQAELSSLKKEISLLESSISTLLLQYLRQSIRREFLGSDSLGRLYWMAASPDQQLRFIAYGNLAEKVEGKTPDPAKLNNGANLEGSKTPCPYWYESNATIAAYPLLVSYQSNADITDLIGWLRDNDPKERALKDAILHWQKFRSHDSQDCRDHHMDESPLVISVDSGVSDHPATKAALFLESKYGPCLDLEINDILKKHEKKELVSSQQKIYRCKCLEPVFPTRFHCLSCHKTFLTEADLETHREGKCISAPSDNERGKEIHDCSGGNGRGNMPEKNVCLDQTSKFIKYQNDSSMCPYDIEEISSKFITKDSNRELVKQIGLVGSNGVPSFVPSRSPYLDDSTVMLIPKSSANVPSKDLMDVDATINSPEKRSLVDLRMSHNLEMRPASDRNVSKTSVRAASGCHKERDGTHFQDSPSCRCVVPSSSLRQLVGKASNVMRRLKVNLLDMEAAVTEEAFRPSRSHIERRWVWRSFVKAAQTIYEMIQATIILEDMIKTQYLRNEWWYWSSLSAAIKTSTISALALRIYSLDSCIIYEKSSPSLDSADNMLDQRPESASDTLEKPKASRKSSRKRKEVDC
ncbi:hypothetical protein SAY87_005211 [Trapa incisa]|uniref:PHD-type domain-containing protein n=1 Tax=Trapa incisa TaxID=236973 RepID=A0AAN7K2J1_9MYRT|nr:hypothetical protein SAY87_005211 [Trapa incisa]